MWILAWRNCSIWHLESTAMGDVRLVFCFFSPSNCIYLAFEMLSRAEKDRRWAAGADDSRWWLIGLFAGIWSGRFFPAASWWELQPAKWKKEAPKGCLVHQPARLHSLFATFFFFSCVVVTRVRRTAELSLFIFVLGRQGPGALIKWSE